MVIRLMAQSNFLFPDLLAALPVDVQADTRLGQRECSSKIRLMW